MLIQLREWVTLSFGEQNWVWQVFGVVLLLLLAGYLQRRLFIKLLEKAQVT